MQRRYNLRPRKENETPKESSVQGSPPSSQKPPPPPQEEKFDKKRLLKLLQKTFPSKHMDQRVEAAAVTGDASESENDSDYETVDSVEEEEDGSYEDDEDEEDSDDEECSDDSDASGPGGGVNIFVMESGETDDSDSDPENKTLVEKYIRTVNRKLKSERKYVSALSEEEQRELLARAEKIQGVADEAPPLRVQIIRADIPEEFKVVALRKAAAMQTAHDGEYHKLHQWCTSFLDIPFGKIHPLPVSIDDGPKRCEEFIRDTKAILDKSVYGLDEAKLQILQWIGTVVVNPTSPGTAIGLKGPMGTGKTTLARGISEALRCPFVFISLGGATDSSFFDGHSITYEGSTWGQIVQSLMQCKCSNPVFLFDELDKVSGTPKGEEIINLLIHIIDQSQNDKFQDKYFSGVYIDLSKAKFIFSFNDETLISPILRDRMTIVQIEGGTTAQKVEAIKLKDLPKIRANVKLDETKVVLPDETLVYIIENFTAQEKGMRKFGRALETIFNKINLKRFEGSGGSLFKNELNFEFPAEGPLVVTPALVGKLLHKESTPVHLGMYL
jgi:ATP-dependent Lon protease